MKKMGKAKKMDENMGERRRKTDKIRQPRGRVVALGITRGSGLLVYYLLRVD